MAVDRRNNIIYFDGDGEIEGRFRLLGFCVSGSGGAASAILHDESGGTPSSPTINLSAPSGETLCVTLPASIRFENAIQIDSSSNIKGTLFIEEMGS